MDDSDSEARSMTDTPDSRFECILKNRGKNCITGQDLKKKLIF